MASESDRILAAGVPITLSDGREVRVRIAMRGLKALEDHFGSVDAALRQFYDLFPRGEAPPKNERHIGTVLPFLAAGLVDAGFTEDSVYDVTDYDAMPTYIKAIASAIDQAFPDDDPAPAEEPGKAAAANGSPGEPSTSPPLVSVGSTTSSGA